MQAKAWAAATVAALVLAGCADPSPGPSPNGTAAFGTTRDAVQVDAGGLAVPWPPGLHDLHLVVDGQDAAGLLAVPDAEPTTLVVVAHGWGGDSASHRPDLEGLAEAGAVAVAMDYRGPRPAFKVTTGVEDTVAATLFLQDAYPSVDRTLLYGWSMGGEVALLAAMAAPAGTYDYIFTGAGVMDLEAIWRENALARPAVEAEVGGAPIDDAAAYAQRSPLARAGELAGLGIARVFLVHGIADGMVPLNHAERMYQALEGIGVPVSYYVVTRDQGTVCSGDLCLQVDGPADHFAGRMQVMWPFLMHRIERVTDPIEPSVRGTYDAQAGSYEPSDAGRP